MQNYTQRRRPLETGFLPEGTLHSDMIPGHLYTDGSGSGDKATGIGLFVYYLIAAIVFFAYAKAEFSLGLAIVYSVFWPFGVGISVLMSFL